MKHSIELTVATNKMALDQFQEWEARQQHGEIKATVKASKTKLTIKLESNDRYALEDAHNEMNYIAANGY